MVSPVPHPVAGTAPNVWLPFRIAVTPLADPVTAPGLGEHSDAVLRGDADAVRLRGSGAARVG